MWVFAPRALQRFDVLPVREVSVVGVKYLAPDAVVAALRLGPKASLFENGDVLAARVRELNGVAEATIRRRLPGTLEIRVREVDPAALVPQGRGGALVVVDAKGRALPFDPERAQLDLPVVATRDSGVVAVLALVQSVDPGLFQTITGARAIARGDVLLECGSYHVLLRRDALPGDVRAVTVVTQDLAAKGRTYAELDARFEGQVVVRGPARAAASGRGL